MDEITIRDPADLAPHRSVRHMVGRWKPDSEAMVALRRSIQEHGVLQPVLITEQNEIMDGVTRVMACKALGVQVPCTVRPETEAVAICLDTELHRRHQTKGQLAFRLAPLIQEAWEERRENQLAGKAPDLLHSVQKVPKRVEDYAAEQGVSYRLLAQAQEIHTLFDEYANLKFSWGTEGLAEIGYKGGEKLTFAEYFTQHILAEDRPMGLGAALAGMKSKLAQEGYDKAGRKHGGGRPAGVDKQLRLFTDTWVTLEKRYEYWAEMPDEVRDEAVTAIGVAVSKAPTDLLDAMLSKVKAELKRRKKDAA